MSGNNGHDNDTDVDIEIMATFCRQVFEAAQNVVAAMQDGDRVQIKQLAQPVSLAVGRDAKYVLGFVNYFAHHTSLAYVSRGKNGGLIKGTKSVKVGKKQKKNAVVPAVVDIAITTPDFNE